MKNRLIANGSIQDKRFRNTSKTCTELHWEIKQKTIIEMSADRGAYICQSQSLNVFVIDLTSKVIVIFCHKSGLKTGMYYLRTKSLHCAVKFTVDRRLLKEPISVRWEEETVGALATPRTKGN
jgi:ribonucleoside-diphosphate reductase alpha chain